METCVLLAARNNRIVYLTNFEQHQPPMPAKTFDRVAFTPGEFAALFGKSQTWGYRQIYAGKVNAITEHGRILIPATEVERILGTAGRYNGLKPTVPKRGNKISAWKRFLAERRKPKGDATKALQSALAGRLPATGGNARQEALARLGGRGAGSGRPRRR
jgi:hypothetical protein